MKLVKPLTCMCSWLATFAGHVLIVILFLSMQGWKKEHVVDVYSDGRIISVLPSDPKLHRRKVLLLEDTCTCKSG